MNIKIFVAHHKPAKVIKSDIYMPVQVGKALSGNELDMIGDNEGDNISNLNPAFCEMTAIYWGWKNVKADYVGLCHYRRFFTDLGSVKLRELLHFCLIRYFGNIWHPGINDIYTRQIKTNSIVKFEENAAHFESELRKWLNSDSIDAVIPTPYHLACMSVQQFFTVIGKDHLSRLKKIVDKSSPEFGKYFDKTMEGCCLYAANMFIFKHDIFEDYCNTIFPILFEHLESVKSESWCVNPLSEGCYSRISGYLAELLTSAYILKIISEGKKIKYVNVLFLEE